nr:hypothetical protein [uncultured bacterium]
MNHSNEPRALAEELRAVADGFRGTLGYSFRHLRTGDELEHHGDEPFPTASTIKLALLCAAMDMQQRGEIGYEEERVLTEETRAYGTGFAQNYRAGTRVELRELLHLMITASDNSATVMLGQWLGREQVNRWLDRQDLRETRLLIPFPFGGTSEQDQRARAALWRPFRQWGMGVTTPREMRLLLEMIVENRAGTPAACDQMLRILGRQFYDEGIASQVPPWVKVASKNGTDARSRSDVAVVHAPSGDYVLAVYTKDAEDVSLRWDNEHATAIRAVSRAVWSHYHPQVTWRPPAGAEKLFHFQTEPRLPAAAPAAGAAPRPNTSRIDANGNGSR